MMRLTLLLAALLIAVPCLADPHYVLMKNASDVPPEVEDLIIRSWRLFTLGRLSDSIALQNEALRIHRRIVGNDSPELIATLEGLVDPQVELDQRDAAMETCREMLRLAERNFPKSDYRIQSAKITIRNTEHRFGLAEQDRKAIAAAREDFGLALMVGTVLSDRRMLLERCYPIYRSRLGPTSCEVRMIRQRLSDAFVGEKRFDDAVGLVFHDLEAMRTDYGSLHPFYAEELAMLSMIYQLSDKDELAIQHGRVALNIFTSTDCNLTQSAQLLQNTLVVSYVKLKQYEEADAIAAALVRRLEKQTPVNSEDLATALFAWSCVYSPQQNHERMIPILERLVEVRRQDDAVKARDLAEAERLLALSYLQVGRPADAEPLLRHAMTIYHNHSVQTGKKSGLILCQHELGECLASQKRWDEAIPLLTSAHRRFRASLGTDHSRTQQSRDVLTTALRAVGREAEADQLTSSEPRPFPPIAVAPENALPR